jgi:hypothetical protein
MKTPSTEKAVEHFMKEELPGIKNSITYNWHNTAGAKMHVHVSTDEFGVLDTMIINVGSSGTTTHNIVNALGRVLSIAIQRDKKIAMDIVQTLEGFSSEVDWISEELGRAPSIPDVISKVLLRHIDIETAIEDMHSGEEEECQNENCACKGKG